MIAPDDMTNSTPEPDGSFKDYVLRVPPDMQSVGPSRTCVQMTQLTARLRIPKMERMEDTMTGYVDWPAITMSAIMLIGFTIHGSVLLLRAYIESKNKKREQLERDYEEVVKLIQPTRDLTLENRP
jgi:hypothetical protein